jgi:hypothetical protein
MITLSWVESEIEKSLAGEPNARNVYDLAALITVRAYLAAPSEAVQAEPAKEEAPKVYLSDYCADLDKVPRLEQIEQALAAVAVEDREQLKRAKDMKTWAGILGGKV